MPVSKRLMSIAGMIRRGATVADIGTDHAYLPVFLVNSGISSKAFACDIGDGPLENARWNIEKNNVKNVILRKGDGLNAVNPNEADTFVIAGMGGDLIARILDSSPWVKSPRYELVLQPMTAVEDLREYLLKNGFNIVLERAVTSQNRTYTVMKVQFDGIERQCDALFYYVGRLSENLGEAEIAYIKRKRRIIFDLANDIKHIADKKEMYAQLCEALQGIDRILGICNGN